MSQSPKTAKELKKLQREWNKKLKDSGFVDAEEPDGRLKRWHGHYFHNRYRPDPEFQASKEEYYRMAGHFLYDHAFEDDVQRLIWSMHAEGKGQRVIIKELKHRGLRGHFDFVGSTIRNLAIAMKKRYQNG